MRPTRPTRLALALFLPAALLATACSGDDGPAEARGSDRDAPGADAFPVTIEHAFGETEIDAAPERVVTWGWGSTDAAIALGVVPVAIPFDDYAGDDEGVLPWVREALDEMGVDTPQVLPNAEEPPFEAIAAADPDVILAAYSGITEEEYDLLAGIAPTVAYPDEAWATPWRDLIEIVGTSLGRGPEATELVQDIDDQVAAQAEAHPELAGKTMAMVWDTPDGFYVYKPADARVEFGLALGLESAPSVEELSTDESTFFFTLSHEQLDRLTSDILVSFADSPESARQFLTSDHAQLMTQVQEGRVASVTGSEFVASVSPPTALSLPWGLDEYVTLLSDAARVADGQG